METQISIQMKNSYLIFFLLLFQAVFGQKSLVEIAPPGNIKTIIFKVDETNQVQFPLVRLNETFTLQFDDLNGDEAVYYYQITHCDADWQPSNLLKSEYIRGLDDQYIYPYSNSYGTLQPYSNYRLTLPNDLTRISLTGNYMLTISDDSGNAVFSRRFIVYNPSVTVDVDIKRSRDLQFYDQKQVVQFAIREQSLRLQNPQETVKTVILKNYQWNTAIYALKPQYVLGGELMYRYDSESAFWGGNEYLYFDNKDIRSAMTGVYRVERNDLFEHILFTATSRANNVYTYSPDINGDFLVQTVNGENAYDEADYAQIHFSVEALPSFWSKEVYVYGKFSNYELLPEYQLTYDEKLGLFVGDVLLKQGFYNYNYAVKNGDFVDYNFIGGNFFQTENNYLVLVYYRAPGLLYDQVIGVGAESSNNITR